MFRDECRFVLVWTTKKSVCETTVVSAKMNCFLSCLTRPEGLVSQECQALWHSNVMLIRSCSQWPYFFWTHTTVHCSILTGQCLSAYCCHLKSLSWRHSCSALPCLAASLDLSLFENVQKMCGMQLNVLSQHLQELQERTFELRWMNYHRTQLETRTCYTCITH